MQHNEKGTRQDLVLYRLEVAKSDIKSAKILLGAEEVRHASDYDDFYIATREEAEEQIATAVELVEKIEKYVAGRI